MPKCSKCGEEPAGLVLPDEIPADASSIRWECPSCGTVMVHAQREDGGAAAGVDVTAVSAGDQSTAVDSQTA
jgi:uncharacterized Zn finger protein